jgi:enamine deaminase RidA (YjgF/YER057c/UK114 family)
LPCGIDKATELITKPAVKEKTVSAYEKLDALKITLPKMTAPVAAFVPFVRSGNMVFLAGHLGKIEGKPWSGQLGANLTTEQGKNAARAAAIDLLGTLDAAVGDLNRIKQILKLMVLVNCTPTFVEQHLVANGASELLEHVFGDKGKHVRCAFGVAQIPFGACVEIDLIAEVTE